MFKPDLISFPRFVTHTLRAIAEDGLGQNAQLCLLRRPPTSLYFVRRGAEEGGPSKGWISGDPPPSRNASHCQVLNLGGLVGPPMADRHTQSSQGRPIESAQVFAPEIGLNLFPFCFYYCFSYR